MHRPGKPKKSRPGSAPAPPGNAPAYSPQAQELRALLRRVPDGFQATINALAARPTPDRERVMAELARGMGKEILPLVRAAALGSNEDLSQSALRVLPVFGTRAAGDVLVEAYQAHPGGERARIARQGALALQARGIHVAVPEEDEPEAPRLVLRETLVSAPDGVGSRSVAARLQDAYGVWYTILVLWNDQVGIKDGFMRPVSRQEWAERMERVAGRGLSWTPCPTDFARWQIAQAREINARSDYPLKDYLHDWDQWVGPPPEGYRPPDPAEALRSVGEEERSGLLTHSQDLFEVPDARRWFLEAADLKEWSHRWLELQTRFRLRGETEALKQEILTLIQGAADSVIDEEQQRLYRERLVDLSRVLEWRQPAPGTAQAARHAAAAAAAIDEGMPPRDHAFFIALVQRSLTVAESMIRSGEDPERSRYRPHRRYQ